VDWLHVKNMSHTKRVMIYYDLILQPQTKSKRLHWTANFAWRAFETSAAFEYQHPWNKNSGINIGHGNQQNAIRLTENGITIDFPKVSLGSSNWLEANSKK
jgi:hypothetical protein